MDDRLLVARARDGDAAAFEVLVRRHSGAVYRIALRITGSPEAAQDVAQEAFVTAWRRMPGLRDGRAFTGWLYRIVTNRSLMLVRARPAPTIAYIDQPPAGAASQDPVQHVLASDLRAALGRALTTLTPQQRACWVLRELEGMSYDEIAEVIQSSPDAVRGRIHRARQRLAQELTSWR